MAEAFAAKEKQLTSLVKRVTQICDTADACHKLVSNK
jgi:hypothetical protein